MMRRAVLPLTGLFLALSGAAGVPATAMPVPAGGPGGFATSATATPIKLDIFEPAIPVPAEPQGELNVSYSHVEGTSGPAARSRASALWPGDPVGEGFKTIGDTVGLPPQLTENGYPLQVNAQTPGGPEQQSQEPLPGMVTRAQADPSSAVALAGYGSVTAVGADGSDDGGKGSGDGDSGDGGSSPLPGLPALPGLPTSSGTGLSALTDGLSALTGSKATGTSTRTAAPAGSTEGSTATAAEPADPLGALSAVVDAASTRSVSRTSYAKETVVTTATSALGNVKLLGGIIELRSIVTQARTESSLDGSRSSSSIRYAGLTIGGTPFQLTKDGVEAAGQGAPIPGLPDDPADALKALGVSMSLPKPVVTRDGVKSSVDVRGIKVVLDTTVLRSKLPSLPMDKLTAQFPESAKQLTGLLLALNEAHPRIVAYLGSAQTEGLSVPPVSFGDFPGGVTGDAPGSAVPGGGSAGSVGGTGGSLGGGSALAGSPVTGGAGGAAGATGSPVEVANVNAAPGLPKLGTVPGLLMMGGLALAGAAGWWMRRAGLLVLGGAANCSHGLASGIPDLRKA